MALGYRYLETDVRATRDGVAVLVHDPTLDRVAGEPAAVADLRWADLAAVRVGGASTVPTLAEVLAGGPGRRRGSTWTSRPMPRCGPPPSGGPARRGGGAGCCSPRSATRAWPGCAGSPAPAVATSLGRRAVARLRLASLGRPAALARPRKLRASAVAAQVPLRAGRVRVVDPSFVRYAHRLGLQVHVWTVDDAVHMHQLLDLGVDGIMSDRLEVLRDVYRSRGHWHPGPGEDRPPAGRG